MNKMPRKETEYMQYHVCVYGDYKKRLEEILRHEDLGFTNWIKKIIDEKNPIVVQQSMLEKGSKENEK